MSNKKSFRPSFVFSEDGKPHKTVGIEGSKFGTSVIPTQKREILPNVPRLPVRVE